MDIIQTQSIRIYSHNIFWFEQAVTSIECGMEFICPKKLVVKNKCSKRWCYAQEKKKHPLTKLSDRIFSDKKKKFET